MKHIKFTTTEETLARHHVALLGSETEQQLNLRVQEVTPGYGQPLHRHLEQSETFHVIRGRFRFRAGDEEVVGEEGFSIFIPNGVPHCFVYEGDTNGKILSVLTPGTHDEFVLNVPKAQEEGMPKDELAEMALQSGTEILGPGLAKN